MLSVSATGPEVVTTGGVGCRPLIFNVIVGVAERMLMADDRVLLLSLYSPIAVWSSAIAQMNDEPRVAPLGMVTSVLALLAPPPPRLDTVRLPISVLEPRLHVIDVER